MQYSLFLRNKIKRQLAFNGQNFEFKKVEKDSYGQTKLSDKTICIKGIFHQTESFLKSEDSEGARIVKKPQPMVLALYDECLEIDKDDEMIMSNNRYKVVGKTNLNNLNVAFDISLEVLQ